MKKIILTIIICGTVILNLTGCNTHSEKGTNDIHSFAGTIIECNEKNMIVRPNEDEAEYKASDKFSVVYVNGFNSCKVNAQVKKTYDGQINETYPAQIGTTEIELIIDYDPRSKMTKDFFVTIQNKLHYAVHEHTAAELIYNRVDNEKPYVGMTNFKDDYITIDDVKIAKII